MQYKDIELEFDGAIASIVLARPEARNAMTVAMGEEIQSAVAAINEYRRATHGLESPYRGVDAPGNVAPGAVKQLF